MIYLGLSLSFILSMMIFFHFLADYPLQGDFLSKAKNRFNPIPDIPWFQAMFAHSYIHSSFVYIATGSSYLALAELIIHFITDDLKCAGKINYNVDQFIHVYSKILYVLLIHYGIVSI